MTHQAAIEKTVKQFRQILVWPLQLDSTGRDRYHRHWEVLESLPDHPWQLHDNEMGTTDGKFKERHYREFVAFLPYVQRFLYGYRSKHHNGQGQRTRRLSLRIYRRRDISAVRIQLSRDQAPVTLSLKHADLYFFNDLDIVLLNIEVEATNLPLHTARELMYRFGRAYPTGWDEHGESLHNSFSTEWLDHAGQVLASSSALQREHFLDFTAANHTTGISAHWAWLLQPLVLDASDEPGSLRFHQVEYHRMPLLGYLAIDNPRSLERDDWIRLGLVSTLHPDEPLPTRESYVAQFEERHCYDRYWTNTTAGPNTRFLCTGSALIVVGDSDSRFFLNPETGLLGQFRHQISLLFLIAHLHRSALLSFSDRMANNIDALVVGDNASVRRFKRSVRTAHESFLRFSHRYWFHEVSERAHIQALFGMTRGLLGTESLHAEVQAEMREMSYYLDSDAQRRESNTMMRLTVVTTLGLIGTLVTGFFGMNLLAMSDEPMPLRIGVFVLGVVIFTGMTLLAVVKSKRVTDLLEALSDESLNKKDRRRALRDVLRRSGGQ
ncbi:MAG: hypothetical protein IPG34_09935 [Rhodocyclaceae bacterium]|nr:hypothetical protein [Rhodocyclaceae bacterium]